jgi:phage baseplate assembly protein V
VSALDGLRALVRPLARRVSLLVARGVTRLSDDSPKLQTLQVALLQGETRGPLERFGQFGWTSRPPQGSEVVALFPNGSRDHGLIIAVEDRATRIRDLEEGESAAYNAHGVTITLKRDGSIEIVASGGVAVSNDVEVSGSLKVKGSIDCDGSITAQAEVSDSLGNLTEMRTTFNTHTHAGVTSGPSVTAPPATPMT